MSVTIYALACFIKVFLAIIQSKNVQHTFYVSAFFTSILMSMVDIIYIRLAVQNELLLALIIGSVANAVAVVLGLKMFHKFRLKGKLVDSLSSDGE